MDEDECSRWIIAIQEGVAAAFNDRTRTHSGGDSGAQANHNTSNISNSPSQPVKSNKRKSRSARCVPARWIYFHKMSFAFIQRESLLLDLYNKLVPVLVTTKCTTHQNVNPSRLCC